MPSDEPTLGIDDSDDEAQDDDTADDDAQDVDPADDEAQDVDAADDEAQDVDAADDDASENDDHVIEFSLEDHIDAAEAEDDDVDLESSSAKDPATKLDLARVYIEMGDIEEAEKCLKEVLTEGDDAQKIAAQNLLDSL